MPVDPNEILPRLRHVDAVSVLVEGREMICLTDALRLVPSQVLLSPPMMVLVMHLDGTRTLAEAREGFLAKFGLLLPVEKVQEFVETLDRALLLDTERFREHQRKVLEDFDLAAVREPCCAGSSYEADPEALRSWMQGLFSGGVPSVEASRPRLAGLVAPHYDLRQAGSMFAEVYGLAARHPRPDVVVVLGTGHFSRHGALFTATAKDFNTPLGLVQTDGEAVEALGRAVGEELFLEEILHRAEHSVEFQVLFIRHVFPGVPVVPILVSNFHRFLGSKGEPSRDSQVQRFLSGAREVFAGRNVLYVASVDFAHVGARFGDPEAATEENLAPVEAFDNELLGHLERVDPAGFFRAIDRTADATRICGFPALYMLLHLVAGAQGERVRYAKTIDDSGSAVTYATLLFTEPTE